MNAVQNTHSQQHATLNPTVRGIYSLTKASETINYRPFHKKLHNKFLLWQGVKLCQAVATLRSGLRLPEKS